MDGERRGFSARAGITALNWFWPGLGLLRLGHRREGWRVSALAATFYVAAIAIDLLAPVMTPASFAFVILFLSALVPLVLWSFVRTWRLGRTRGGGALGGLGVVSLAFAAFVVTRLAATGIKHRYEAFDSPSTSMSPTLQLFDYWLADVRDPRTLARGDVIVFRARSRDGPPTDIVKRVIGLPGDSVAVRGGIPIVNGIAARGPRTAQREPLGRNLSRFGAGSFYREQLPSSTKDYLVLDSIAGSAGDEFAEITVPIGHVFVMGDNRDDSLDSRFGRQTGGFGMIPLNAIRGRALFIFWSRDQSRVGTTIR